MGPASNIIEICGGHEVVAAWLTVDVSRVYRWTYEKARGGSDGHIPSQYHQPLLLRALAEGKRLKPDHFFPDYRKAPRSGQRETARSNHQGANHRAKVS